MRYVLRIASITIISMAVAFYGMQSVLKQTGWTFMLGAILAGASLFALRLYARIFYGLTEVAFAFLLLWSVKDVGKGGFSADFSDDFARPDITSTVIASLGAIYVLIRGFDNLHQGFIQLLTNYNAGSAKPSSGSSR